MKAYTNLEQSKKLAEILPLESADGFYESILNPTTKECEAILVTGTEWASPEVVTPAWSLAALLDVLPDYTLQTNSDGTVFVVCDSEKPMISDAYDNPVDACVEMIEKLHELKML